MLNTNLFLKYVSNFFANSLKNIIISHYILVTLSDKHIEFQINTLMCIRVMAKYLFWIKKDMKVNYENRKNRFFCHTHSVIFGIFDV